MRILAVFLLVAALVPAPAFSLDSEDSQIFISGFNAYQNRDYKVAAEQLTSLLQKYPDTALKDMALFWLARANYKAGNQQEAAKYMAQFLREYPKSPLKGTVEEGLVALAEKYEKGERIEAAPKTEQAVAPKIPATQPALPKKPAPVTVAPQPAAVKPVAEKAAAEKAAQEKRAAQKLEAAREAKSNPMLQKAIEAYKAVVDKYPGTPAAASASAKLRELGVEYPAAPNAPATSARSEEVSQVFNLEVAQFADLKVQMGAAPTTAEVGQRFMVPIEIYNAGNGSDSFLLYSGFPREFNFHFAAAETPDLSITTTPELKAGERFRAVAVGTVPRSNIDGQKNRYPVKIVSSFAGEVSQSREIVVVSTAPLLRAVVKSDKPKLLPGERISYRISLLNIGSGTARGVAMTVTYPPQLEPTDLPSGAKPESKGALVLDGLQFRTGESKDFTLTFRLKDEALAEQELFLRADVVNRELDKRESFVSPTSVVQRVSGVTAKTAADKLMVIPGQVVSVPLIVTNTGNVREGFAIKGNVPGSSTYTFFYDVNRDGKRQPTEPIINHVGPLSPKEEAYVVLEIATPVSADDGAKVPVSVAFEPENAADRTAAVNLQLTFSRPVLELTMAAKGRRLKPGEVSSLELDCSNRGSNLAKQVVLQSILPAQLELVAADPVYSAGENGVYTWRFDELGAGEKRSIYVTYRVKPGIAVGTNMQLKNLLNYQDQLGNRY